VFERWPAMGRTGPDIYPNPYGFVIDVKSRQAISNKPFRIIDLNREVKWYVHAKDTNRGWYMCRLDQLETMFQMDWNEHVWHSVVVEGWLNKMQDWASDNGGTGMLVLHKPRKPIGSSLVLLDVRDWLPLLERMELI
jgi:hypothetical protein